MRDSRRVNYRLKRQTASFLSTDYVSGASIMRTISLKIRCYSSRYFVVSIMAVVEEMTELPSFEFCRLSVSNTNTTLTSAHFPLSQNNIFCNSLQHQHLNDFALTSL
jgi:hypothetical protein